MSLSSSYCVRICPSNRTMTVKLHSKGLNSASWILLCLFHRCPEDPLSCIWLCWMSQWGVWCERASGSIVLFEVFYVSVGYCCVLFSGSINCVLCSCVLCVMRSYIWLIWQCQWYYITNIFQAWVKGTILSKRLKLIELELGNYTQIEIVFITSRNTVKMN